MNNIKEILLRKLEQMRIYIYGIYIKNKIGYIVKDRVSQQTPYGFTYNNKV